MLKYVHVIHGGQAAGGEVSSSREKYAAELSRPLTPRKRTRPSDEGIISFSEEDLEPGGILDNQAMGQVPQTERQHLAPSVGNGTKSFVFVASEVQDTK